MKGLPSTRSVSIVVTSFKVQGMFSMWLLISWGSTVVNSLRYSFLIGCWMLFLIPCEQLWKADILSVVICSEQRWAWNRWQYYPGVNTWERLSIGFRTTTDVWEQIRSLSYVGLHSVCKMARIKRARSAGQQEEMMHFTSAFDHDSLDCVICMEHLVLPIYQVCRLHYLKCQSRYGVYKFPFL